MSDAAAERSATERPPASPWRSGDFRRLFAGTFVTNAGDSLYTVAVMWLAYDLTGSTTLTGIVNAILLLPWLFQVLAGPVVDRIRLKPVLVGSQLAQGVAVLTLPLAAVRGVLTAEVLLAVAPILMLGGLFVSPARTALLPRIVDDGNLSSANSAIATVTLGLDMLFDAAGGVLIAGFGATTLFVLDSVTFAIAALLFAGIAVPDDGRADPDGGSVEDSVVRSYVADIRDGIEVLRGTVFVEIVAITAVANFATGVTLAILPAFGGDLGGPAVYGLLLGALGVGRLVGSVLAPYLDGIAYGRFVAVTYAGATCCWLGSVAVPGPWETAALFGAAWVPAGVNGVFTSTLNQSLFPSDHLGRVSTIKGTAAGATLPLGSLLGGVVAETIGTMTTMALAAVGFAVPALAFSVRPRLRRLPAVADAVPSDFGVSVADADDPSDAGERG